jgi:hypothetical protein
MKRVLEGGEPGDNDAKRTQFRGTRRPAEYPVFHYSIIPPFQTGTDRAKRTQFPDREWAPEAKCAKRTQFHPAGR